MSEVIQMLKDQLPEALENQKQAKATLSAADKRVNDLLLAIAAIEQGAKSPKTGDLPKAKKPRRKRRGAVKKGVLDAIRNGFATRADILTALTDAGIKTTANSVSNVLTRLQEQKLIEGCPTVRNGWRRVESPRANGSGINEESPPEVQSEGLSLRTDMEASTESSASVSGGRDQSGIALVPFA